LDYSTLLAGATGLDKAKRLVIEYKTGKLQQMTPELWQAKKIIDATLHPGMSMCYLIVRYSRDATNID